MIFQLLIKKFSFTVIEGQLTADYGRLIHDIE